MYCISHGTMHSYFLPSKSALESHATKTKNTTTDNWQSDDEGELILFLILFL